MSTTCMKCGASVFDKPLMRVNEKGVSGIWWCEDCVKSTEPELYRNEIEDGGEVLQILKELAYTNKTKI